MTREKVLVAWQTTSGSNVKFRSGTYEDISASEDISPSRLFSIFPNPVQHEIFLPGDDPAYRVMTLSGQIMLQGKGKRIDVRMLLPGLYYISTRDGFGKFVKQ
jgi:hypothetical protein